MNQISPCTGEVMCTRMGVLQIMGSKNQKQIEDAIRKERDEGRATYFGESIELVSNLQLQELCKPGNLPRSSSEA